MSPATKPTPTAISAAWVGLRRIMPSTSASFSPAIPSRELPDGQCQPLPAMSKSELKPSFLWVRISWVCAASSLVLFVDDLLLELHVRLILGYWPRPFIDDGHGLLWRAHNYLSLFILVFSFPIAPPLWIFCITVPSVRPSLRVRMIQAFIYLLGWGLEVLGIFFPTPFTEWTFDG